MSGRVAVVLAILALGCGSPLVAQARIRRVETGHPAPACAANPARDTTVRDGADLSSPPDVRTAAFANYDVRSIPRGEARFVMLRFVVQGDGVLDSTRVVAVATDDSTFIPVARQTLQQMRFWPACIGDTAVATWVQQRFRYVRK